MKRTYSILVAIALISTSCDKEISIESSSKPGRMSVNLENTKVQLNADVKTVWNEGDLVSVFPASSYENQRWEYIGEDKSVSGEIEYNGNTFVWDDRKTALFPYDENATFNNDVITTFIPAAQKYVEDSYGFTMMTAKTSTTVLRFKYATAFIRLRLQGYSTVKSAILETAGGEQLSGKALIDMSGSAPLLTMKNEGDGCGNSITVSNSDASPLGDVRDGEDLYIWFAVAPGTYSQGFTATVNHSDDLVKVIRCTGPVTVNAGEYLTISDSVNEEFLLHINFAQDKDKFSPALPTSGFTDTDDTVNDKTFTFPYLDNNYEFKMHAGYYASGGKPSYGYYYTAKNESLLIGRTNAYITFPRIENHILCRMSYVAGSGGGTPRVVCTDIGKAPSTSGNTVSRIGSSTTAGERYDFDCSCIDPEKDYHLVVGGGNLLIKELFIYYKRIK